MLTGVLHNFVATRSCQCCTGSEYSRQVDQRGSHSRFTCRQVSSGICFCIPSHLIYCICCVFSVTTLRVEYVDVHATLTNYVQKDDISRYTVHCAVNRFGVTRFSIPRFFDTGFTCCSVCLS